MFSVKMCLNSSRLTVDTVIRGRGMSFVSLYYYYYYVFFIVFSHWM